MTPWNLGKISPWKYKENQATVIILPEQKSTFILLSKVYKKGSNQTAICNSMIHKQIEQKFLVHALIFP